MLLGRISTVAMAQIERPAMRLGPYEPNTIVAGDCLDVMAQMPDGCVDLVVTGPPTACVTPEARRMMQEWQLDCRHGHKCAAIKSHVEVPGWAGSIPPVDAAVGWDSV